MLPAHGCMNFIVWQIRVFRYGLSAHRTITAGIKVQSFTGLAAVAANKEDSVKNHTDVLVVSQNKQSLFCYLFLSENK